MAVLSWFRRDRLTGQVAVGLVGVLVIAAGVYGVGVASAQYRLADVGAWLAAKGKGMVVHVNGPAGKVDGKAGLIPQMHGHNVKIVQDGSTILIVDLDTGVVSRLDPSQLNIGQSRSLGEGIQVLADSGKAFTVDSVKGVVQQIDPVALTPVGPPADLPPPLGQAGIDGRGALWVPVSQKGEVSAFRDGRLQPPVRVAEPGAGLALTIAAGDPVVVDSTAATATVVRPSGSPLKVSLPTTVRQAGRGGVLAPSDTDGKIVPLLVPGTGSLVTVDTGTGRYTSTRLPMPKHRYRAPQILGAKVYIPDETAGALIVYDSAANRFEKPIPVTNRPSRLDVFVKDGMLWANDPSGPRAVVVDRRGVQKDINKYRDRVAGGPKRRTIPLPGDGDAPPARGRPGTPQSPWTPRGPGSPPSPTPPTTPPGPGEPPTAPANVSVTPGAGTMRVGFQPSQGEGIIGYVLKDVPAGLTASPSSIGPGAGPFMFTVTGGDCGTEYQFRVAVRYKDAQGRTQELPSTASDPVRPCVTPGAPTGLQAQSTKSGAKVSWTAPPGAGAATYKLTWSGPVSGSKNVSGTSATLGEVWTNGNYTFTVAAANGAGTGTGATISPKLTGPTSTEKVQMNGNSDGYIRSAADHNSSLVATMKDNNGDSVTVHCQKRGTKYTHPNDSSLSGDMYTNITWKGKRGYVIGYLITTDAAWTSFNGPAIWKC
ncbi:hypothetical protein E1281_29325 [Actinomadura sp. KC345]|uniref:fibronectin type III domain-containing protein n=1 Tax=Actinomadura sp. KC345 TaxID=2530371 RepID=UPI00104A9441|nr:fibronectin type III domain-containing protein [Actinomadura sp. KC345]TDC45848.1 hypothetical protein E1281_29325 [Actinomadura sp. KC345]